MAIRIEIKDDHVTDLINFYSSKQRDLREKIAKLENELRDVNATIAQLRRRPDHIKDSYSAEFQPETEVFSSKWPWQKKIAYAIKEAGKPITTKEIVEILEFYEPKLVEERKSAISSVSSTLSVKSGKHSERKHFVKSLNESGDFIYETWEEKETDENLQHFGSSIIMDDLPF